MSLLGDLLGLAGQFELAGQAIEDVRDVGTTAMTEAERLGNLAVGQSRFRPFTVSSNFGNFGTTADPTTGALTTNLGLSGESQQISDAMRTQGLGFINALSGGRGQREQNIFDRLEALQAPERERQMLSLEERLFNQGRSGVRTSQFGGTPEQLAMAKAIEESRATNAAQAMDLARADEAQVAQIGQNLLSGSFTPQQNLMNLVASTTPFADIASTADRQGAQLFAGLGEAGLQSLVGAESAAANLRGNQLGALAQLLGAQSDGSAGLVNQLIDRIGSFF